MFNNLNNFSVLHSRLPFSLSGLFNFAWPILWSVLLPPLPKSVEYSENYTPSTPKASEVGEFALKFKTPEVVQSRVWQFTALSGFSCVDLCLFWSQHADAPDAVNSWLNGFILPRLASAATYSTLGCVTKHKTAGAVAGVAGVASQILLEEAPTKEALIQALDYINGNSMPEVQNALTGESYPSAAPSHDL